MTRLSVALRLNVLLVAISLLFYGPGTLPLWAQGAGGGDGGNGGAGSGSSTPAGQPGAGGSGLPAGNTIQLTHELLSQSPNLVVPAGMTAFLDVATTQAASITGNLVNSGNIYLYSSNSAISAGSFAASNINNHMGATISSILPAGLAASIGSVVQNLSMSLSAVHNFSNAGIISAAGTLNIAAGGNIVNALPAGVTGPSPIVSGMNGVNLFSAAGTFTNAGTIASQLGSVNFHLPVATDLVLNNIGGTIRAAQEINFRDSLFTAKDRTSLLGGVLEALQINFWAGDGRLFSSTDKLDGAVNIVAGKADIFVNDGSLNIASMAISGDPTFASTEDIYLSTLGLGSMDLHGIDLAIISGKSVYGVGLQNAVDLSCFECASERGGDLTILAGVDFTPPNLIPGPDESTTFTINGPSQSGGEIQLPVTITTESGMGRAGNIRLAAFAGDTSEGVINVRSLIANSPTEGGDIQLIAHRVTVTNAGVEARGNGTGGRAGDISFLAYAPDILSGTTITDGRMCQGGNCNGDMRNWNVLFPASSDPYGFSNARLEFTGGWMFSSGELPSTIRFDTSGAIQLGNITINSSQADLRIGHIQSGSTPQPTTESVFVTNDHRFDVSTKTVRFEGQDIEIQRDSHGEDRNITAQNGNVILHSLGQIRVRAGAGTGPFGAVNLTANGGNISMVADGGNIDVIHPSGPVDTYTAIASTLETPEGSIGIYGGGIQIQDMVINPSQQNISMSNVNYTAESKVVIEGPVDLAQGVLFENNNGYLILRADPLNLNGIFNFFLFALPGVPVPPGPPGTVGPPLVVTVPPGVTPPTVPPTEFQSNIILPTDAINISLAEQDVPMTTCGVCPGSEKLVNKLGEKEQLEGKVPWYVAAASCQIYTLKEGDSTIVAAGGTSIAPLQKGSVKLGEGKVLAITDTEKLSVMTPVGAISLAPKSAAIIEEKGSGVVRVTHIAGPDISMDVESQGKTQKFTTSTGEELIVGNAGLDDEEFIPVDGVDRVIVSVTIALSDAPAPMKVTENKYDKQQMMQKEQLLNCKDCLGKWKRKVAELTASQDSGGSAGGAGNTGGSGSESNKTPSNHQAPKPAGGPVSQTPDKDFEHLLPVANYSAGARVNMRSLHFPDVDVRTSSATVAHTGTHLKVTDGEALIVASKPMTLSLHDNNVVQLGRGAVALVNSSDDLSMVRVLYNTNSNSVRMPIAGKNLYVDCGQELIVSKDAPSKAIMSSPVGRRRVRSLPKSKLGYLTLSEISIPTVFFNSNLLKTFVKSPDKQDRAVLGKVMKTTAALGMATGGHGQFTRY